ncbi:MAG: hypothetical protein ABI563_07485 [Specibacter sp.]
MLGKSLAQGQVALPVRVANGLGCAGMTVAQCQHPGWRIAEVNLGHAHAAVLALRMMQS